MMTLLRKIADVLAVVFHPVFYSLYGYLLLTPFIRFEYQLGLFLVLLGTVICPISITYFLTKDIQLQSQQKRPLPLILSAICYLLTLVYLTKNYWWPHFKILFAQNPLAVVEKTSPEFGLSPGEYISSFLLIVGFSEFLLSVAVGLFIVGLVSKWYKISLHACGIGLVSLSILTLILRILKKPYTEMEAYVVITIIVFVILVFSFLILWQRIKSKSHDSAQVISGFLIGIFTALLVDNMPMLAILVKSLS